MVGGKLMELSQRPYFGQLYIIQTRCQHRMIFVVWFIMKILNYKDYKVANHGVQNLNRLKWKKGQYRHLNIIGKQQI